MNRTGLRLARLLLHNYLAKTESLVSPVSIHRNYHFTSSNRSELLKFTPTSITFDCHHRRNLFSSKESKTEEKDAKAEEAAEEVSEAEKALQEQVASLEEKSADLLDKYRRSLADFENLRNRMNKQVSDAKIFGIQGFCKDLLDVADVLNKAISSVPESELKESQSLSDLHQGLQLTESQLLKVFAKHGLVQENPIGEKFDPNKHDALFQIPAPDKEPNTVLDVQKIGYILHGRTIRPAAVGVSKQ